MALQLHPHRPLPRAADREAANSLRWTLYLLFAAFSSPIWGFAVAAAWRAPAGRVVLGALAVVALALACRSTGSTDRR